MADELPEISQDINVPLPQVPPTSALVPYRTSRTVPSQAPVVTTGYGPRARPVLQPPSQGAAGIPDTSRLIRSAFEQLPVDKAIQAINAAQQFMGQRLFAQAVQRGTPAAQAWVQYGPMMFSGRGLGGSGFSEALQATVPRQMTLYQTEELARQRAKDIAQAQKAAQDLQLRRQRERRLSQPSVTTTEETPAVEAQPAIPATTSGFWPFRTTIPAVPAVQGRPKKVVRTTTRGGEEEPTEEESPEEPQSTPAAPTTTPNPYKVGSQYGKFVYKGGDPNTKSNWEEVK